MNASKLETKIISRRSVLHALAALPFIGMGSLAMSACAMRMSLENPADEGLGALAARKDKIYGAAVQSRTLNDTGFAQALIREAGMLVPEWELKWEAVQPSPGAFDFSGYRRITDFARAHNMAMRGHTLVWHWSNPKWLEPALKNEKAADEILRAHISRVIAETSPFIRNWDVVNEALDPRSPRPDGLRETLWLKALGPDYIARAFHYAHETGPGLTLVYNDFRLEEGSGYGHAKRQACLMLLEKLRRANVPVHVLGLQSHLQAGVPLGGASFTGFLKDVRAMGLDIIVTELDLDVSRLSGRVDDKITFAQNYVHTYLDMIQESGEVNMLLTWGLSDKYSWLRKNNPHLAGALPLDARLRRGAMCETLRSGWVERA